MNQKNLAKFLNEAVSYTYKPPKPSPKTINSIVVDFYLISLLDSMMPESLDRSTDPSMFLGSGSTFEDIKQILSDANKKIVELNFDIVTQSLLYSIVSEMRHARIHGPGDDLYYDVSKEDEPIIIEILELVKNPSGVSDIAQFPFAQGDTEKQGAFTHFYETLYKKYSIEKLMNMFADIFRHSNWDSDYGGPKWADACKAYIMAMKAKSIHNKEVAIDHIYDLQHNTGFVLNKTEIFETFNTAILDLKRDKDPEQLVRFSSLPLRIYKSAIRYIPELRNSKSSSTTEYVLKDIYKDFGNYKIVQRGSKYLTSNIFTAPKKVAEAFLQLHFPPDTPYPPKQIYQLLLSGIKKIKADNSGYPVLQVKKNQLVSNFIVSIESSNTSFRPLDLLQIKTDDFEYPNQFVKVMNVSSAKHKDFIEHVFKSFENKYLTIFYDNKHLLLFNGSWKNIKPIAFTEYDIKGKAFIDSFDLKNKLYPFVSKFDPSKFRNSEERDIYSLYSTGFDLEGFNYKRMLPTKVTGPISFSVQQKFSGSGKQHLYSPEIDTLIVRTSKTCVVYYN